MGTKGTIFFRCVIFLLAVNVLIILTGCASGPHQFSEYQIPKDSPKGYICFYNFYSDYKRVPKGFNIYIWSSWNEDGVQTKMDNQPLLRQQCDISLSPFIPGSRDVSCIITVPPGMHTFYIGHLGNDIQSGRAKVVTLMARENMIKLVRVEFYVNMGAPRRGYGYTETPYWYSLKVVEGGWIPIGSDANAVKLLLEAMKNSDWGTRWHAAERFGDINVSDTAAIQAIKETAENDPDPDVRDIASKVLKKIMK